MTPTQAKQLGKLIARTRERQGFSLRRLAREIGADPNWLIRLERGEYRSPAPERLARIAELLDIDPERLDRITRGHVSGSLPEMRTYFRTLYTDLSDEDIGRIENLVTDLRKGHGGSA